MSTINKLYTVAEAIAHTDKTIETAGNRLQKKAQSQTIQEKLSSPKIKNRFISSGISHLSLFWSYARNEATKNSDLDILIELSKDNKVTIGTLEILQEMLRQECNVKKVDFVTKRKINPYLKEYIENDLITIF